MYISLPNFINLILVEEKIINEGSFLLNIFRTIKTLINLRKKLIVRPSKDLLKKPKTSQDKMFKSQKIKTGNLLSDRDGLDVLLIRKILFRIIRMVFTHLIQTPPPPPLTLFKVRKIL